MFFFFKTPCQCLTNPSVSSEHQSVHASVRRLHWQLIGVWQCLTTSQHIHHHLENFLLLCFFFSVLFLKHAVPRVSTLRPSFYCVVRHVSCSAYRGELITILLYFFVSFLRSSCWRSLASEEHSWSSNNRRKSSRSRRALQAPWGMF